MPQDKQGYAASDAAEAQEALHAVKVDISNSRELTAALEEDFEYVADVLSHIDTEPDEFSEADDLRDAVESARHIKSQLKDIKASGYKMVSQETFENMDIVVEFLEGFAKKLRS